MLRRRGRHRRPDQAGQAVVLQRRPVGGRSSYQAGNYYNKRQGTVFYEPDLSRPATTMITPRTSARLTWQAAAKHKIVGAYTQHPSCQCVCPAGAGESHLRARSRCRAPLRHPEATAPVLDDGQYTYPATNRFLIEADGRGVSITATRHGSRAWDTTPSRSRTRAEPQMRIAEHVLPSAE